MSDFFTINNVVTLIAGAVLGIIIDNSIKIPKLVINSQGSGSANGFSTYTVGIINEPGLIGIKLGSTKIFGKRIHPDIEKGWIFDRVAAKSCVVRLFDKRTNDYIGQVMWRPHSSPNISSSVTLKSGETATLVLFAQEHNNPTSYFLFQPESQYSETPKIPPESQKFNDTHEFILEIQDYYGINKFKNEIKMVKQFGGNFYLKAR